MDWEQYGQNLAAVQIAREQRLEIKQQHNEHAAATARLQELQRQGEEDDDIENAETDDEEEDDYGPTPAAGIWAGSEKLQQESINLGRRSGDDDCAGDEETDDEEDEDQTTKKARIEE